ncbi:hypothetical protein [Simiduia agarivorans]|uniref:Mannose-6-phosphate isomerase n=1 Tax=Simiduia agarivorans (strain DSM 21679 / JCM 13881 / BCRC 17597 / SA1) TaxID=1117647 RepID=K4KHW3_SIMAS|nr:hypothetical protein [Simiduia agarivorans]AFU97563.1 hypothetical protein M5M_01700 [Simiduia agarivorans SA1 = DSM 21679]
MLQTGGFWPAAGLVNSAGFEFVGLSMHVINSLAADSVEACLLEALARPGVGIFEYRLQQDFLPGRPPQDVLVVTLSEASVSRLAVLPDDQDARQFFALTRTIDEIQAWLAARGVGCFSIADAWCLGPVIIAKPWGREVWFTGVEARGQSAFVDPCGSETPLSWLLSLLPRSLLGARQPALTLLKILDPLPEPVFGDLYFEMHEQKQEVYVVTRVDAAAWPGGQGGIRFGFNQQVRDQYDSDDTFRLAYLEAVRDYEAIRRRIDGQVDALRLKDGVGVNEPVAADQQKAWLAQLPPALMQEESEARARMDGFAHVLPLQVGDVVKVPCYTPHSLMHGVTTVEFQTPVYERKILSFAQKVLTQDHWDTAEALEKINLDTPVNPPLACVFQRDGVLCEQVVRFDDFRVLRLRLDAGCSFPLTGDEYALLMIVTGSAQLDDMIPKEGAAYFLPAASGAHTLKNRGLSPLVVLLSEPV